MLQFIDKPFRKWSVWASIVLAGAWGSVSAYWMTLDAAVQADILSDFGIGPHNWPKLVAYTGILGAATAGAIGALRVIKQASPPTE